MKPKIIYVRESAVQSIIADLFSFGTLAGVTTINFAYWGGRWYTTLFIFLLWLVFIGGRASQKQTRFNTVEEAIAHLQKEAKQ